MGREIRMVVPNWEHPEVDKSSVHYGSGRLQPMYDSSYKEKCKEWHEEYAKWDAEGEGCEYWDYYGTPDEVYHRPDWKEGEATWIQLYETVSEGTPVTPPFETKEELVNYLVENGDFWYQEDAARGQTDSFRTIPTRAQAESLVDSGWALSGVMISGETGLLNAYQQQDLKTDK